MGGACTSPDCGDAGGGTRFEGMARPLRGVAVDVGRATDAVEIGAGGSEGGGGGGGPEL